MTGQQFTLADLKRILRDAAGETGEPDQDIIDTSFEELGYESISLLETGSRIEREYGITLGDSVMGEVQTPRALLAVVHAKLAVPTGT